MLEQASSPLQTQLATALALHGGCSSPTCWEREAMHCGCECWDEAEALVPLVERLVAEAERRSLTQATAAMRLRNEPFTDWIDEQRQWIDDWQNGYFSSTSRDEHGWPMEMHGLVQALGSAVDGLAALAGLAIGPPPQETPDA